jgi:hypothetical protein
MRAFNSSTEFRVFLMMKWNIELSFVCLQVGTKTNLSFDWKHLQPRHSCSYAYCKGTWGVEDVLKKWSMNSTNSTNSTNLIIFYLVSWHNVLDVDAQLVLESCLNSDIISSDKCFSFWKCFGQSNWHKFGLKTPIYWFAKTLLWTWLIGFGIGSPEYFF